MRPSLAPTETMRRALLFFMLAALLSGCAARTPLQSRAGLTVLPGAALPAPTGVTAVSDRAYRIGPLDKLRIDVVGVDELSREVQVDSGGIIAMPVAGSITATGLTSAELASQLEVRLRQRFVRNPQVIVNVRETLSQTVTIDGEVRDPGLYPVLGQMTLVKAVASAKGTTEFARLEDVIVFRTVGDKRMAAMYNLGQIRRGAYDDPPIYADDLVIVGDSPERRRFRQLLQLAPTLLTPIVILLQ
jgi:polysaccharide biosynthesis/export protein